jgi:hypothetical protein
MIRILLATALLLTSCATKPDPATLFPIGQESEDYQTGFRAGFYEGLAYNHAINEP